MLSNHPTKHGSFISKLFAFGKRKKESPEVKPIHGTSGLRKPKEETPPEDVRVELTDEMSEKIIAPLHQARCAILAVFTRLEGYMKFMSDEEFN
ncbi:hypothetical protein H0H87_002959, partial [Tephrocybe sp. NHM501043]